MSYEAVINAIKVVAERDLTAERRPAEIEGIPELPMDPTDLDDAKLMGLLFSFTEWTSYAQSELACATAQEKGAEIELARVKSRVLAQTPAAKTVTAQKNAVALHGEVIEAEDEVYRVYCIRTILEPIAARAERNAAAISRELSRRQGRSSASTRAAKWGT